MKIDLTIKFEDAYSKDVLGRDEEVLTLRNVIAQVLLENIESMPINGEEKVRYWQMYEKHIQGKKECDISVEEMLIIKKRIIASWPALIVGPLNKIFKED